MAVSLEVEMFNHADLLLHRSVAIWEDSRTVYSAETHGSRNTSYGDTF